MFGSIDELKNFIKGKAEIAGDAIKIVDEAAFRNSIRELAANAALSENETVRDAARWIIIEGGQELGIVLSSINDLYMAAGKGEYKGLSVPAVNLRGFTFDTAAAAFRSCLKKNNTAIVFEIARSEMEYTFQRPPEYTTEVMAAAISVGYRGPLFMQGDHFQLRRSKFLKDKPAEMQAVRDLIKEAVAGGYYNIDIDASTLVDIDQPTLIEEQRNNYEMTAEMTKYIREIQPKGINISIGGEIGEVGDRNSTKEDLEAYMEGYVKDLPAGIVGLSKVSVQTGTTHGGIPRPDGSVADVKLDFSVLEDLSKLSRDKWGMGGAVQHGASTLPDDLFHKFPATGCVEIHLATGFQNIIVDSKDFPADLRDKMYKWLDVNCANERKDGMTNEQFYYKSRKKAWGPFKSEIFNMPEAVRAKLGKDLEEKFDFLFEQLGAVNTKDLVADKVKLVRSKWPVRPKEL
ncbi:MAG TPA: class II fructose-bisphosphate aldolase [bacterium]|nr:class II fructose-bisphosphate aldolase [bacterium]